MDWIAINICLLPSKEIKQVCNKIYREDNSLYSSEDLEYIPHITLFQKSISKDNLKNLIEDLEKIEINKFELEVWDFIFSTLFCLEIKRNKKITDLQKKIIYIVWKYSDAVLSKDSFLTQKYFFEDNINWVKTYWSYIDYNKYLHITLWKDNQYYDTKGIKLPKVFLFDNICIWLMWNYCSVRKILKNKFSKNLTINRIL